MTADEKPSRPCVDVAIAVVEHQGKCLIGLRPKNVLLAGYWEFPGGKIRKGESPEDAAIRECQEETGLAVRVSGAYPQATYDYKHARVQLHFFACEPIGEPTALPPRFRWVLATELGEYDFPPANDSLLRILANRDASQDVDS